MSFFGLMGDCFIYVFITGKEITKFAYKHWENGMQRKDLSYSDLEESLNLGAFNELGRYLAFSKLWNRLKFMQ